MDEGDCLNCRQGYLDQAFGRERHGDGEGGEVRPGELGGEAAVGGVGGGGAGGVWCGGAAWLCHTR